MFLKQGLQICAWGNTRKAITFLALNSQPNCRFIGSILIWVSFIYIHLFSHVIHSGSCCIKFVASNFGISNWLPQKFPTSNFASLNFKERSWIFRLEYFETSSENLTPFHRKFTRTKEKLRQILFALLLNNTVPFHPRKLPKIEYPLHQQFKTSDLN